ncbi:hypothetical protein NJB14194_38700 [Mycobacterium montefiorense]|uniref:Uncharacterized protein n=1 Tax=Mycobacterium montefiorense TaxID=154654 RepID=A0AA37PK55_9MYCO|nr:hypothetical protein NJB14194_38700 [Mycobacterium montefiorense]GKU59900.1 hypothetical protein NJB18182_04060 [Mycobacterium montefiorense]GKU65534.1 hypothetical protein NJB18183_06850 [Mycobacterium montefiorense]GKU71282.1 hypothetical protein NJB18185_10580 [Mycobacterium montefiorense]
MAVRRICPNMAAAAAGWAASANANIAMLAIPAKRTWTIRGWWRGAVVIRQICARH